MPRGKSKTKKLGVRIGLMVSNALYEKIVGMLLKAGEVPVPKNVKEVLEGGIHKYFKVDGPQVVANDEAEEEIEETEEEEEEEEEEDDEEEEEEEEEPKPAPKRGGGKKPGRGRK